MASDLHSLTQLPSKIWAYLFSAVDSTVSILHLLRGIFFYCFYTFPFKLYYIALYLRRHWTKTFMKSLSVFCFDCVHVYDDKHLIWLQLFAKLVIRQGGGGDRPHVSSSSLEQFVHWKLEPVLLYCSALTSLIPSCLRLGCCCCCFFPQHTLSALSSTAKCQLPCSPVAGCGSLSVRVCVCVCVRGMTQYTVPRAGWQLWDPSATTHNSALSDEVTGPRGRNDPCTHRDARLLQKMRSEGGKFTANLNFTHLLLWQWRLWWLFLIHVIVVEFNGRKEFHPKDAVGNHRLQQQRGDPACVTSSKCPENAAVQFDLKQQH